MITYSAYWSYFEMRLPCQIAIRIAEPLSMPVHFVHRN